jgi:transposase-like protein
MQCPDCGSHKVIKNGINATGKQNYKCNSCGRQFVLDPIKSPITDNTKDLIDRLLLERIPLAGIARVTGVSAAWLQSYVNQKYQDVPREVIVKKKSAGASRSNVTNCGRLLEKKIINNGFGSR